MKIGIIAWGAMCDVLVATPIVKYIRELHPNDHMTWLVRDKFANVVATNPHVDNVELFGLPPTGGSRQDAEYIMDQNIREFAARNYDKVYDLQYWPTHTNFNQRYHEDFISLRARNAGLEACNIKDRNIVLEYTDQDEEACIAFYEQDVFPLDFNGLVTVNHISYAADAVWSFDSYQQLVDLLHNQHGIRCIFTGAADEPIPNKVIDARDVSYREWAGIIQMSDLYLGLDSGAKALAAATDTPMIILQSPGFPLHKTGCKAMGIRTKNILELTQPPTVDSLVSHIVRMMKK